MQASEVTRLRELLADAVRVANELGDDARPEPVGVGYFATDAADAISDAIEAVASYDGPITLFVGAGVSMEAELPSWTTLVRKLLVAARRPGDADETVQAWADMVLQEGPLAAAAVAQALHDSDTQFRAAVRDALYERDPQDYVPGALATQIAWLKAKLQGRLALLTVNYDGLLEAALKERDIEPVSYVRAWSERPGTAAVWHLHGRLMRDARDTRWVSEGNFVLSEGAYVRSTAGPFPQEFVAARLADSVCVFVGLSMTDPNFIRWLYNSPGGGEGQRFVIFVRQASLVTDPDVREILERSAAARWRRYGVTPVWANYYGEVAQIIHEIGLRCDGSTPTPFAQRAAERFAAGVKNLSPPDPVKFVEAQHDASALLRDLLDRVRRICDSARPKINLTAHHLGLGLWAVDHQTGRIMNWVSSDRAYEEPDAVISNPLHVDSRWVAAAAIANGVPVEEDPMVYASRWRFVRGIPLIVGDDTERSIVGALTLTSTTPLDTFPLAKRNAPAGILDEIDNALAEAGRFFLP